MSKVMPGLKPLHMANVLRRFERVGDLYAVVLSKPQVGQRWSGKVKISPPNYVVKEPYSELISARNIPIRISSTYLFKLLLLGWAERAPSLHVMPRFSVE